MAVNRYGDESRSALEIPLTRLIVAMRVSIVHGFSTLTKHLNLIIMQKGLQKELHENFLYRPQFEESQDKMNKPVNATLTP